MPLGTGGEALETLFLTMPLMHFLRYYSNSIITLRISQMEKIQSQFSNEDLTTSHCGDYFITKLENNELNPIIDAFHTRCQ